MRRFYLLCIILLTIVFSANAQDIVDKQKIIKQLQLLRNSIAKPKSTDVQFLQNQNSCRTIINDAIINIDSRDKDFPIQYLDALISLTRFSDGLLTANSENRSRNLQAIKKDLIIKFNSGEQKLNSGEITRLVQMSVFTYQKGRPANSLRVNYSALGNFTNYLSPDHQFTRLTSPASEEMVPGIYEMWITNDGGTTVLRRMQIEVNPSNHNHNIEFNLP